MQEADWLTSTDPQGMLSFLRDSGKASDRKLRLWAAACCRRVWDVLDDQDRKSIEVTERSAEGTASDEELRSFIPPFVYRLTWASAPASCDLLREVFGLRPLWLPFLTPSVLQWHGGLVRRLAEQAYNHRILPSGQLDHARLAVLADALLEAGCDDADILSHLRDPGPHWRGCFALDHVLDRS